MTGTTTIIKGQETKPLVRYQLQAGPERTRLMIDFNQSQHELLEHFIELLLHRNKEDEDNIWEAADGSREETAAAREYPQGHR
ncbi:MAG: hypothetical protein PHU23_12140 [Dehalococcoidales bacterium]|nr:hypothetical protein [Dehalococcoidales bacterium]